jgi:hypothetical protein
VTERVGEAIDAWFGPRLTAILLSIVFALSGGR